MLPVSDKLLQHHGRIADPDSSVLGVAPPEADTLGKARARSRGRNEQKKAPGRGPTARGILSEELASHTPDSSGSPPGQYIPPSLPATSHDGAEAAAPTSSILAAVGSHTSPRPTMTNHLADWTRDLPVLSDRSSPDPSAAASLSGSPSQPPVLGEADHATSRTVPATAASPAQARRPVSHPNTYQNFAKSNVPESSAGYRRVSMHSHRPQPSPYVTQPPLPHQPQPHFYALPDADFGTSSHRRTGSTAGEDGLYCGFDTLAAAGDKGSQATENVLLVGRRRGLDVFRLERGKVDVVGRLEGLRGAVVEARIVPCTVRTDPFASVRPLVAVIIHGPAQDEKQRDDRTDEDHTGETSLLDEAVPPPPNRRPSIQHTDRADSTSRYQTTVEIYSLSKSEHITTLFTSPPVAAMFSNISPMFSPPPPTGGLRLELNGNHIVVASGYSGELFLFTVVDEDPSYPARHPGFRCLGKVWAAVQADVKGGMSSPGSASDSEGSTWDTHGRELPHGLPIFTLSQRWLAYLPASRTMKSLMGTVTVPDYSGQSTLSYANSAPPQPLVTCAVDVPDAEGLLNRVTREVAQEFIKGAKWVGDQGIQAWRSYWTKPSPPNDQQRNWMAGGYTGSSPPTDMTHNPGQSPPQFFPPTHAHRSQTTPSNDPALVSIVDLAKVVKATSSSAAARLSPIATFSAPLGCSYLSFAPGGLILLSASRKGDVQFVWDLMRIVHWKSGPGPLVAASAARSAPQGPLVRQIARFSRMTVANIVDVAWSHPRGERLAIVTDKGTVHLFDLPSSAFQWPPPRRSQPTTNAVSASAPQTLDGGSDRDETSAATVGTAVSAAVKMVANTAQPILSAAQRRRGSSGPGFGGVPSLALSSNGLQGGKYMAAGLSKSLGAASGTITHLRKVGDTRIHIPSRGSPISPRSVRWLSGRERGQIGVVGTGVLRLYGVAHRSGGKGDRRQSAIEGRAVEVRLPHGSETTSSTEDEAESGFWGLRSPIEGTVQTSQAKSHPLSYAEIETNPPYQPFHTDHRVQIFAYENPRDSLGQYPEVWAFGEDIPTHRLAVGPGRSEEASGSDDPVVGRMEKIMRVGRDEDQGEQIVVTTRRRKRTKDDRSDALDDGFFEDDCEVLDFAADRV